jgi:ribosomal protein S27AE
MPQAHSLPESISARIQRPLCPRCHTHMMLARISPARVGFDLRTFECPNCNDAHEVVVANDAFGRPFTPPA